MEDLKRYIREGREKGVSDKKLKKHLLDNGFGEERVEDAFLAVDTEEVPESLEEPSEDESDQSSQKQRKDFPEKFMDQNKNFGKLAKKYSGYAIKLGKIRYKISFGIAGFLLLLGIVLGIAVDPSFFVISAFCIIPLGVGLLSRYNVRRAEKYWEERKEMKKQGRSSKSSKKDENYFDFSKKSTVGGYAYAFGLFFGFVGLGWVPPLIIYKYREDKIDKEHARRALNWNLSFLIYSATIPVFILVLKIGLLAGFIAFILGIAHIALSFIAANKATRGEFWDIPLSINFVSMKEENRLENDKEN